MRSAVDDMRAMVSRIIAFVADRGDRWTELGSPDRLLLDAAALLTGVANGLERAEVTLTDEVPQ